MDLYHFGLDSNQKAYVRRVVGLDSKLCTLGEGRHIRNGKGVVILDGVGADIVGSFPTIGISHRTFTGGTHTEEELIREALIGGIDDRRKNNPDNTIEVITDPQEVDALIRRYSGAYPDDWNEQAKNTCVRHPGNQ